MEKDSGAFREFSRTFEHWKWLVPPVGDLHDNERPTYGIELDLDHEMSALESVGSRALRGDTMPDWPAIVPKYLADLEAIVRRVESASIPEPDKEKYKTYIAECRAVWEKISFLPVPVDGHLGFRGRVLEEFQFLENPFHFRVVQTTPIMVRYESSELFVTLRYSPRAPYLSLELGRLREDQPRFSVDDLWHWAGLGLQFDYDRFDLESRNGLANFVAAIARFVQNHAALLLRNDSASFDCLIAKQAERERLIGSEGEE